MNDSIRFYPQAGQVNVWSVYAQGWTGRVIAAEAFDDDALMASLSAHERQRIARMAARVGHEPAVAWLLDRESIRWAKIGHQRREATIGGLWACVERSANPGCLPCFRWSWQAGTRNGSAFTMREAQRLAAQSILRQRAA